MSDKEDKKFLPRIGTLAACYLAASIGVSSYLEQAHGVQVGYYFAACIIILLFEVLVEVWTYILFVRPKVSEPDDEYDVDLEGAAAQEEEEVVEKSKYLLTGGKKYSPLVFVLWGTVFGMFAGYVVGLDTGVWIGLLGGIPAQFIIWWRKWR